MPGWLLECQHSYTQYFTQTLTIGQTYLSSHYQFFRQAVGRFLRHGRSFGWTFEEGLGASKGFEEGLAEVKGTIDCDVVGAPVGHSQQGLQAACRPSDADECGCLLRCLRHPRFCLKQIFPVSLHIHHY